MPAGTQVRGNKYDYKVLETLDGFAIPESLDYDPDRSGYLRMNGENVEKYILGTGWLPIAGANNYPTSLVYDLGQLTLGRNGLSDLSVTIDKAALGLGNVEDVALSTWAGSDNITNVGVITDGVWNGMAISPLKGGIPPGGTTGQVIKKLSATDYDVAWGDEDGVGGGSSAWGDITGTLSDQIDLITALNGKQPIDADLTAIAGLTPSNDDIIQRKAGAWTNRTLAQYKVDLAINNVDNTSDINKPVSTAQAAAIALKQDLLVSGTNIKTINGSSILGSGNITISGGTSYTFSDGVVESGGAVSIPTNGITSSKINAGAVNDSKISDVAWAKITGTPTTVAGYGISDAVTLTGTQTITNKTISGANNTLSNIALTALVQGGAALNQVLRWNGTVWAPSDESTGGTSYIFTPADFNNLAGTISIDYTNGQAASGSTKGFLTAADWLSFNGKQNQITTGSTAQYFRGDLSLATFPTNVSTFVNDAGYLVNITGKISAGTNVSITGSGTTASPYVISSTASGLTDGDKGDITVSSSGATWTVDLLAITNAKINDVAWSKITSTPTTVAGYGITDAVTLTGTQTLTNKTLTSPKINVGSDATGDVYFRDGSGNLVRLAIGSTGQVLKVVSGLPAWAADATGGGGGSTLTDGDYGDVTVSATGTAIFIDNGAVTNAKLANVATATLKGRVTASTGVVEDLTGTQATTLLDVFSSTLKGLVPLSGGGTVNFLRADGTWAAPSGGTTYTFTASDFNESGTTISIDYSNGQAATTSLKGFLTATDWNTFNNKQNAITTGSTAQYFRGDLSLATFPTNVSTFTNDAAYLQNITGKVTAGTNVSITGSGTTASPYVINASASGTVTGVSGTTNRITSTGGASPVIDISASYVGQSSITTLGNITTGVWNGTAIADSYISSAATWNAKLSNITGLVTAGTNISLTGSGTSGSPYVINATAGTAYTGTANRISIAGSVIDIASTYLGQSSITTLGTIASGTWNATPIGTTKGGVPTGGTAGQILAKINGTDYNTQWIPAPTLELIPGYGILIDGENNISVDPDILTGGGGISDLTGDVYASGAGSVTATIQPNAVTTGKIADANVTDAKIVSVAWSKITSTPTTVSGYGITDAVTLTGTQTITNKTLTSPKINLGSDATGDTYYRDSSGNLVRIPVGTNGQVLKVTSGLPAWGTDISGGGGVTDGSYTDIVISGTGTVYTVANNAITTAKILDGNVTNAKLANSSITHGAPGTSGTAPNWSASSTALGGTATLNIPLASATGVTAGLVSKTNYDAWQGKQDLLVSGSNIKTINGASVLGSGDISIPAGGIFAPTLSFVNSTGDPVIPNAAETNLIMQSGGVIADNWYRKLIEGGDPLTDDINIYYTTADNGLLDNWDLPGTLCNVQGFYPTVFQIGSTYYMFIKHRNGGDPPDFHLGDIYLYSSTNKTTWTVMNGGSPAITHSSTGTSWFNRIYNVGVAVVGTTLHILVEGRASSGTYDFPACLGYSSADITSPVFTLASTPQIINGYNPDLLYVPERNALLVMYNEVYYVDMIAKSSAIFAKASLSTDLYNTLAWEASPYRCESLSEIGLESPHYPSDFSIAFTPGKTYPCTMTYNYDQAQGYQAYMPMINNVTELFESIPMGLTTLSSGGSSQWTNVTGGINYAGGKVGIGNTSPGQILDILVNANSSHNVKIKNASSGSSASANFQATNDSDNAGGLGITSSGYSTYGALEASNVYLYSGVSQVFMVDNPSGVIRFATGGSTTHLTLKADGTLNYPILAGTGNRGLGVNSAGDIIELSGGGSSQWTDISSGISYTNNANANKEALISNNSSGGAAMASFSATNGTNGVSFGMTGTSYTTYGNLTASDAFIYTGVDLGMISDGGVIKFATSGAVERMRITASGVNINTPGSDYTLPIARPVTNGYVLTGNTDGTTSWSASGGSSNWTITGSDIYRNSKVGIGSTTAPTHTLYVSSASSDNDGIRLVNTGGGNNMIGFGGMTSAAAANATIYSNGDYLVIDSKSANPLYLNFDNASSSATINFFNGKTIFSQTGAIALNGNYGTAGQVLTSAGTGAMPTWEDAGSGGSSQWADISSGIRYTNNANAAKEAVILNNNASGSAQASFTATNGTAAVSFGMTGTGYTTYGTLTASDAVVYTGADLVMISDGGSIKLASSGATPQFIIGSAGAITTPGYVSGYLKVDGSGNWSVDTPSGGGGSGTVTSVAASVPSFLSVSGSPVTTSGTLAISYSGTALPAANGGTGQTSYTTGDLLYASGSSALSKLSAGTASYVLTSNGASSAPSWQAIPGGGQDATYTVLTATTTDDTETTMTGSMTVTNGEAGLMEITVYNINSTNTDSWTWKFIVRYHATSSTVTQIYDTDIVQAKGSLLSGSLEACDVTVQYNGSGDVYMTVFGVDGVSLNWRAEIKKYVVVWSA